MIAWDGTPHPIAAMALGKNAVEAVLLASRFDNGCGMGVTVLEEDRSAWVPS